jgi:hypothetical protein
MRDLSACHSPVGDFLAASQPISLTPAQTSFFETHGYLSGIPILSAAQVEILRLELGRLMDPSHPGRALFYEFHLNESASAHTVLFHALGHWRIEPGFHDLLWHPAFTGPAAQLLGGRVRFWHDQLFSKPARHGGVVAWHQDHSYWTRTQPMQHLTCWIGLDDTTRENGCLWYVPGSHRWNLLPITGLAGDMDEIRTVLTPAQLDAFRPVPIELRAGECSFHHPLMVHGSYENRTAAPRRAAVVNVFRDGTQSASDDPPLAGVPPVPSGRPMSGPFFPLLA